MFACLAAVLLLSADFCLFGLGALVVLAGRIILSAGLFHPHGCVTPLFEQCPTVVPWEASTSHNQTRRGWFFLRLVPHPAVAP